MGIGTNPEYDRAFSAALAWWREAGVDGAFVDEPQSWLQPDIESPPSETLRAAPPQTAETRAAAEPPPLALPDTLPAFRDWWLNAPELDSGRVTQRVPPRGAADPQLMILAPFPEHMDRDRLLSGPDGKLLDQFVTACGLNEENVYWSSALPCHTPGADWSPQANEAIRDALLHHVSLVRPQRLLVLGFVILPLLGHDSPQAPAVSQIFNHQGATIPMLAVRRLPAAASQPRWKSALWQAWLEWSA